ncbi:unnamed protein product [Pylaiella littoralis]
MLRSAETGEKTGGCTQPTTDRHQIDAQARGIIHCSPLHLSGEVWQAVQSSGTRKDSTHSPPHRERSYTKRGAVPNEKDNSIQLRPRFCKLQRSLLQWRRRNVRHCLPSTVLPVGLTRRTTPTGTWVPISGNGTVSQPTTMAAL